tara:strand:- start:979 stop:1158 length:180 start_codon:yes stop_codon:yes gene_type:complete
MDWLMVNIGVVVDIVSKIVAVAAAIAAIAPKGEVAAGFISKIRQVIDILALNVGNAKNK